MKQGCVPPCSHSSAHLKAESHRALRLSQPRWSLSLERSSINRARPYRSLLMIPVGKPQRHSLENKKNLLLKMVPFMKWVVFLTAAHFVNGFDWPSISHKFPTDCHRNESFDITNFVCVRCPEFAEAKSTGIFDDLASIYFHFSRH